MAAHCQVTGAQPGFGHSISHSHRRTKRRWNPNIQKKRYWVPSLRRNVTLNLSAKGIKVIDARGIDAVQIPERQGRLRVLTPRLLRVLHGAGLDVHVWTVNERADMERLLDLGVDGLITDRADVLKDVLVERGGWG